MDDIRVLQFGLKIRRGMIPEELDGSQGPMPQPEMEILLGNSTGFVVPIRVPVGIPEGGIKNIAVLGVNLGKVVDQTVRKISATCLMLSRLAYVEPNLHGLNDFPLNLIPLAGPITSPSTIW
jgi:hypothetical protein